MSNLVIVALPSEDDYVNKISSEKVAHMTLLFLGNTTKVQNINKILDFTSHTVKQSLTRFGLEVDRRAEFGEDKADVIFFSKSKWSGFESINDFRSYLLKDKNIRTAYDLTEQFPEWLPHLTLGYPDSPAKPDNRDYPGITYVNFDRIAVWFNDYSGIEFPLKRYEWETEVAMDNVDKRIVDDFLEHHGVKGMKWGVHRRITGSGAFKSWSKFSKKHSIDPHHARRSARTARKKEEAKEKAAASKAKAAAKAEKKQKRAERAERWRKESEERDFRTTANSPEFKANLNRSVGKALVEDGGPVSQINQKYATYRASGSLKDPNHPATKKYNDEVADAYIKEANKQLSSTTDISGSLKLTAVRRKPGLWDDPNKFEYDIEVEEVKHADDIYYEIRLVPDSNGEIVDFEMIDDVLEQGELFVDDILVHHGVKGMKWGVRRNKPSAVTVSQNPKHLIKRERLKTKGGYGREASEDAIRARTSGQVAKKSGVQALSNAELNDYVNRVNLEQRAKRAQYDDASPPVKFVKTLLRQQGSAIVNETAKDVGSHQVRKRLVKAGLLVPSKAMKAAMAAA